MEGCVGKEKEREIPSQYQQVHSEYTSWNNFSYVLLVHSKPEDNASSSILSS